MNVYATESIRNVVLLGHGGCGKTSLIESMAFTTGIIKRAVSYTHLDVYKRQAVYGLYFSGSLYNLVFTFEI